MPMRPSDVVDAFSAIVAILRSLTSLISVLDSTYPTGTTNDNKRLGTANWRATRRAVVSVSRPVVFQRDYEAAMQIWRGMRRVKYAVGCKRLHREVRQRIASRRVFELA